MDSGVSRMNLEPTSSFTLVAWSPERLRDIWHPRLLSKKAPQPFLDFDVLENLSSNVRIDPEPLIDCVKLDDWLTHAHSSERITRRFTCGSRSFRRAVRRSLASFSVSKLYLSLHPTRRVPSRILLTAKENTKNFVMMSFRATWCTCSSRSQPLSDSFRPVRRTRPAWPSPLLS